MWWALMVAALYGAAIGGCRTTPHPVYEYEPTVTTTWTGDSPPATATTTVPRAPAAQPGEAR